MKTEIRSGGESPGTGSNSIPTSKTIRDRPELAPEDCHRHLDTASATEVERVAETGTTTTMASKPLPTSERSSSSSASTTTFIVLTSAPPDMASSGFRQPIVLRTQTSKPMLALSPNAPEFPENSPVQNVVQRIVRFLLLFTRGSIL